MTGLKLSKRQYSMLHSFIDNGGTYMTMTEARAFDQRPFRSMLIQQWIIFIAGKGFKISPEGKKAWLEFQTCDIARKNQSAPLTAYFNPDVYKLHRKAAPVQTITSRKAAAA